MIPAEDMVVAYAFRTLDDNVHPQGENNVHLIE